MGMEEVAINGGQTHGGKRFPDVLHWTLPDSERDVATDWVSQHRDELLQRATEQGAVLLRGLPVQTADDFDAVVSALKIENFPYQRSLSNAVRINRTERVFSANEAPPEIEIFFHHEMAQTPLYPKWILFSCELVAQQGGATPICRSDVLYSRLCEIAPEFAAACEEKGLQYTNVMPAADDAKSGMGRSWQSTLGVTTIDAAEQRLQDLGYRWDWRVDGSLQATTPQLPAVLDLGDGRKSFFNQLIAAYCGWKDERNDPSRAIRHGDGSPLDRAGVQAAIALSEELAFDLAWQRGDVVLIDNRVTMHARRTFVGPRKVLASLAEVQSNQFAERPAG
ncbi:MAG: TauD/TfdA family dioxygenase [Planctomycetaceae bacterium]